MSWNKQMETDVVVTIKAYDIEDLAYFLKQAADTQKYLIESKEYEHADNPEKDLRTHQNLYNHYTNELAKLEEAFIKVKGPHAKEHFKVIQTEEKYV